MKEFKEYILEKFKIKKGSDYNEYYLVSVPEHLSLQFPDEYAAGHYFKYGFEIFTYLFTRNELEKVYKDKPKYYKDYDVRPLPDNLRDKINTIKTKNHKNDILDIIDSIDKSDKISIHDIINNKEDIAFK